MKTILNYIKTIFVGLLIIVVLALWIKNYSLKEDSKRLITLQRVIEDSNLPFITPRQIQQGLINRNLLDANDPNATDGIPGRITLMAWKLCDNNDYAAQVK